MKNLKIKDKKISSFEEIMLHCSQLRGWKKSKIKESKATHIDKIKLIVDNK